MDQDVWHIAYSNRLLVQIASIATYEYFMEERCVKCWGPIDWAGPVHEAKLCCTGCGLKITDESRGVGLTRPISHDPGDFFGYADEELLVMNRLRARLREIGVDFFTAEIIVIDFTEILHTIADSTRQVPEVVGDLTVTASKRATV